MSAQRKNNKKPQGVAAQVRQPLYFKPKPQTKKVKRFAALHLFLLYDQAYLFNISTGSVSAADSIITGVAIPVRAESYGFPILGSSVVYYFGE